MLVHESTTEASWKHHGGTKESHENTAEAQSKTTEAPWSTMNIHENTMEATWKHRESTIGAHEWKHRESTIGAHQWRHRERTIGAHESTMEAQPKDTMNTMKAPRDFVKAAWRNYRARCLRGTFMDSDGAFMVFSWCFHGLS